MNLFDFSEPATFGCNEFGWIVRATRKTKRNIIRPKWSSNKKASMR